MDKRLWYKMLGKEDAFNRSAYYKANEEPIKLKKLLKPNFVKEIMTPADNMEVHRDRNYILQRKTTGEYYKGGNIHTPTTTFKRGEAAKLGGAKIKDIKYNWPMSWDLIDLSEEPGEDNLGGEKVNEEKSSLVKYFSTIWSRDNLLKKKIKNNPKLYKKYGKYLMYTDKKWNSLSDKELQNLWDDWNKVNENINELHFTGERVNEGMGDDVVKVMTNKYIGSVKRKGLKKLGLDADQINFLEEKYRKVYIGVAKKFGMKTKDVKDNFGNISVYLGDKGDKFMNALKKELSKVKIKEENINELHFTGETLNKVRQDVLSFLGSEHKKLGYTNPLDTYYLIQQVLDSDRISSAAKKIR